MFQKKEKEAGALLLKDINYNKKWLYFGGLLVIMLIGTTFAYFTQELEAVNAFQIGCYDTVFKEFFTPPDNWKPGAEIEKSVQITNNGNLDIVVVAKISESSIRRENIYTYNYNQDTHLLEPILAAKAGEVLPVLFNVTKNDGKITSFSEVAQKNFGNNVVRYNSQTPVSDYMGKWVYLHVPDEINPVYYFIYMGIIKGGDQSPRLLKSVTLNPLLTNTVTSTHLLSYYDKHKDMNNREFTYEVSPVGYDSITYSMEIKAKTVQATWDAAAYELSGQTDWMPTEFETLLILILNIL